MKYIGSGMWALASAYLEVKGYGSTSVIFGCIAILIAFLGSNKPMVSIHNNVEPNQRYPDKNQADD